VSCQPVRLISVICTGVIQAYVVPRSRSGTRQTPESCLVHRRDSFINHTNHTGASKNGQIFKKVFVKFISQNNIKKTKIKNWGLTLASSANGDAAKGMGPGSDGPENRTHRRRERGRPRGLEHESASFSPDRGPTRNMAHVDTGMFGLFARTVPVRRRIKFLWGYYQYSFHDGIVRKGGGN
jgi:hypothetical protein